MAFTKEYNKAKEIRQRLEKGIGMLWEVEMEQLYPAVVVRMGLGPVMEITPVLRSDSDGKVKMLSREDDEYLWISDGNLYRPQGEGEEFYFNYELQSRLVRARNRGEANERVIKDDRAKIWEIYPSARVDYLFDCIPGDMSLGVHSRVYIVTFPEQEWMKEEGLLAVYAFLEDDEKMKQVLLGGVVQKAEG